MDDKFYKHFKDILNLGENEIINLDMKVKNDLKFNACYEVATSAYYYMDSFFILAKNDRTLIAQSLLRPILECYFVVKWILEDKTKFNALNFFSNEFNEKAFRVKFLDINSTEKIIKKFEKGRDKFIKNIINDFGINIINKNINKKYPSIESIANAANLSDIYNKLYRYLSVFNHIDSSNTAYFINKYKLLKKDAKLINAILTAALDYYTSILLEINNEFNIFSTKSRNRLTEINKEILKPYLPN